MQSVYSPGRSLPATGPALLKDQLFLTGLALCGISALVFCLPLLGNQASGSMLGYFFLHYFFAAGYLVALLSRGIFTLRWRFARESVHRYVPFLILSLISAYALNRDLDVFHESVTWLSAFLVLQCATFLLLTQYERLPRVLQLLLFFLLGAGFVLFVYMAVYVLPLYIFSAAAAIFLGISLHTFVPLFFVIAALLLVHHYYASDRNALYCFLAGIVIAISIGLGFTYQWTRTHQIISREYNRSLLEPTDLPAWVRISQQLPPDAVTEKLLKSDLIYTVYEEDRNWLFDMPNRSFDEAPRHDPLVFFASLFTGRTELSDREKIKVLEALYSSRHQAEERLWRGENLRTSQVITQVQLWPEYRLAYTEKIISIENSSPRTTWLRPQEALYTFYLPEGAVVTSLSLWINDVEEKGYLTTKQKADTAYRTIVGVESRDPSLVHWQEGNRVTVRVFPVTPAENRRVKVGITSPLLLDGSRLRYGNIHFDGPSALRASEVRRVLTGTESQPDLPSGFDQTAAGTYEYTGAYGADWELTMPAAPFAQRSFRFGDKAYTLAGYTGNQTTVRFENIYLDLNAAWSEDEVAQILSLNPDRRVYAWNGQLIRLDGENYRRVYAQFRGLNYSLFPVQVISDQAVSLLITKGTPTSANLSDLQASSFYGQLIQATAAQSPVKTFCLGSAELSPYLKSLKEFRVLHCTRGGLRDLVQLLKNNTFPERVENETQLLIESAQLLIRESPADASPGNAPDHLYRLFAYNTIMQRAGAGAIRKDFTDPELVAIAERAYVVSPVSSLIVLETQKDYERFGIKDSQNSLQNAAIKSSGSVPEPHEWALIILVLIILICFLYPKALKTLWQS
jgi:XrtN system VIT domain protein